MSAALQGRRLLVTGGSRGIGRAIVDQLLAAGAEVALLVRRPEQLDPLLQAACLVRQGDLASLTGLDKAVPIVTDLVAAFGGLDGLINCAGVVQYQDLLAVTDQTLEVQWQVNFFASFALSQAVAKHLVAQGTGGDLIQIASTLGERPAPATAVYGATKAALIALTRSYALELGAHGVRANAVAPGLIDTEMIRAERPGAVDFETQRSELAALHPLGRLGTPGEVADAVCYLLASPFVTGTVLTVDGGLSLG